MVFFLSYRFNPGGCQNLSVREFPKIEFSKKIQKSLVGSQENRTFALAKTK